MKSYFFFFLRLTNYCTSNKANSEGINMEVFSGNQWALSWDPQTGSEIQLFWFWSFHGIYWQYKKYINATLAFRSLSSLLHIRCTNPTLIPENTDSSWAPYVCYDVLLSLCVRDSVKDCEHEALCCELCWTPSLSYMLSCSHKVITTLQWAFTIRGHLTLLTAKWELSR